MKTCERVYCSSTSHRKPVVANLTGRPQYMAELVIHITVKLSKHGRPVLHVHPGLQAVLCCTNTLSAE